jgi:glycosyltransferase involved in cell wall biosynthesis
MDEYPRLLVMAPKRLGWHGGGGVTMCNLLKGWPLDRIAQIHADPEPDGADESVCAQHLYCEAGDRCLTSLPTGGRQRCVPSLVRYVLGRQDAWGPFAHGADVLPFVRAFSPQVVYCYVLQSPPVFWTLPRLLGTPYVTHIMDDWPRLEDSRPGLLRRGFWNPVRRWALRRLFRGAALNLGICDEMCAAFASRYGSRFVPFHNCVELAPYGAGKRYTRARDDLFDLVYIGSVHKKKELDSLVELKNAVLAVADRVPGLRLTVHHPPREEDCWNFREFLQAPPHVVAGDYLAPDALPQRLVDADALVLALGFEGESQTYLRYSFQTKVPEYLASGTPVLVYGPAGNPNVLAARRDGWGVVVDRRDPSRLAAGLTDLAEKEELRRTLGMAGRTIASERYDAKLVRRRFRESLATAAGRQA